MVFTTGTTVRSWPLQDVQVYSLPKRTRRAAAAAAVESCAVGCVIIITHGEANKARGGLHQNNNFY
jgi:hypothetical protein